MPHARCSKCRGRRTLNRQPADYLRPPSCGRCGARMSPDPAKRTDAHWVVDHYRRTKERGRVAGRCYPGLGGCHGYSFPHRRGSGYCDHNPKLTTEKLREREDRGSWA